MPGYKKEYLRLLARLSSLGIEMGVSIVVGFFIGRYLDKLFHTGKSLTVIFIFFGVIAGFKSLYSAAKKVEKNFKEHKLDNVYDEGDDNNK